jgi:hypothetical protein
LPVLTSISARADGAQASASTAATRTARTTAAILSAPQSGAYGPMAN